MIKRDRQGFDIIERWEKLGYWVFYSGGSIFPAPWYVGQGPYSIFTGMNLDDSLPLLKQKEGEITLGVNG